MNTINYIGVLLAFLFLAFFIAGLSTCLTVEFCPKVNGWKTGDIISRFLLLSLVAIAGIFVGAMMLFSY